MHLLYSILGSEEARSLAWRVPKSYTGPIGLLKLTNWLQVHEGGQIGCECFRAREGIYLSVPGLP